MSASIVRPVLPEEWPAWRRLRRAALAEAPEAFRTTLAEWSGPGDTEERWRQRLADVALNLIATVADEPVGMVSVTAPDATSTSELLSLWVAPAQRGRGVADALVDAAVTWADAAGARLLALEVRAANAHAIALYARHGFADSGPWPGAVGGPCEVRMVRALR